MHSILYIDDEQHSLTAFRLTFEEDFRIFTANNTKQGLEILQNNDIQLIVTDQRMPEESGVEFLHRIREDYPHTVRTILTGYSDIESIIEAINESHIYYYFKKPWKEEELKLAFRNAIEASDLTSENNRLVEKLQNTLVQVEQKSVELEQQLEERDILLKTLEKSNLAKSEFLSVISHELRTPLNPIIGLSDMLAKTSENEDARNSGELINRCGKNLLNLINRILQFVQLENKQPDERPELINLSLLIYDAVTLANSSLIADSSVEILSEVTFDEETIQDEILVFSYPEALRQILHNLVANACKFTRSGSIFISAKLKTKEFRPQLELLVRDTGTGISPENIGRIFEAFTQVDQSLSRNHEGLGLGLAISKQLAKNVQGEIIAESELGKGSTFRLSLPVEHFETRSPTIISSIPKQKPPLAGSNALIVDYFPETYSALEAMVKKTGCEIFQASNNTEALDALSRQTFEFVLIDFSEKEGNAYQLAQTIRSNYRNLKIIAVAPNTGEIDPEKIASLEIDSIINKPLSFTDLLEQIVQLS